MTEPLSILIYGAPGCGKSWVAASAPGPVLVINAGGASRVPRKVDDKGNVVRRPLITWDPNSASAPTAGDWEVCYVNVRSFADAEKVLKHLESGKHCFESVVVDTLTELQKLCKEGVAGGQEGPMDMQKWGILLNRLEHYIRSLRDLTLHHTRPLQAVVVLAAAETSEAGRTAPSLEGSLGKSLPVYFDVEGYLRQVPEQGGKLSYRLLIAGGGDKAEVKDRTWTLSKTSNVINNPSVSEMLRLLNEEEN
jgi:hypothetical protein